MSEKAYLKNFVCDLNSFFKEISWLIFISYIFPVYISNYQIDQWPSWLIDC